MKQFIINTLRFLVSIVTILFIVIYLPVKIVKNKAQYQLSSNIKYIVLGHSHPECAYNDSLISSFKNFGQSAESYFHIYQKLKPLLKQNKSIKTVFIEYSNNQISKRTSNWIWDDIYITSNPQRLSFMEDDAIKLLIKNNSYGFINLLSVATKDNLKHILTNRYNYKMGGYLYLTQNKTDSILKYQKTIKNTAIDHSVSEIHLKYLKKIIDYCKNNDVEPILIRSPFHKQYLAHKVYQNEKIYKKILAERFSEIRYFDFSSYPLTNDEFRDLGHLNYKGAKKFSLWFNKLLNQGFFSKENSADLIKKETKELEKN